MIRQRLWVKHKSEKEIPPVQGPAAERGHECFTEELKQRRRRCIERSMRRIWPIRPGCMKLNWVPGLVHFWPGSYCTSKDCSPPSLPGTAEYQISFSSPGVEGHNKLDHPRSPVLLAKVGDSASPSNGPSEKLVRYAWYEEVNLYVTEVTWKLLGKDQFKSHMSFFYRATKDEYPRSIATPYPGAIVRSVTSTFIGLHGESVNCVSRCWFVLPRKRTQPVGTTRWLTVHLP